MKIKCGNKGVRWVHHREISDDRIEFDENGYATVSKEVGELLIALPDIVEVKSKTKIKEE